MPLSVAKGLYPLARLRRIDNCVQLLEGAGMFHNCKKDYQKRGMYEGERQDKSPRRTDA